MSTLSKEEIRVLYDNHKLLVGECNAKRIALPTSPSQSNFRVYCILLVETNNDLITIEGTNGEHGFIGGSICAERSALMKLRVIENPVIKKVIVTTDSNNAVSPGMLCREFLISTAALDTIVVMGNNNGEIINECTLKELYPFPYVHRNILRQDLLEIASEFGRNVGEKLSDHENEDVRKIFNAAMKCNRYDKLDQLHPIRFSAAVIFDDGLVKASWQLKGLEYGCTLDPVCQLLRDMLLYRQCLNEDSLIDDLESKSNVHTAKYLVMIDQFGVAHAPFAQARALLSEHGYENVDICVHNEFGFLEIISARSLVPHIGGAALLSYSDFL